MLKNFSDRRRFLQKHRKGIKTRRAQDADPDESPSHGLLLYQFRVLRQSLCFGASIARATRTRCATRGRIVASCTSWNGDAVKSQKSLTFATSLCVAPRNFCSGGQILRRHEDRGGYQERTHEGKNQTSHLLFARGQSGNRVSSWLRTIRQRRGATGVFGAV